jgi:hypothetical protein
MTTVKRKTCYPNVAEWKVTDCNPALATGMYKQLERETHELEQQIRRNQNLKAKLRKFH